MLCTIRKQRLPLRRFATALAFAFCCAPGSANEAAPGPSAADAPAVRLGSDVVPVAQSVDLKLDPALDGYSGSVSIDLEVRKPTKSFTLHAREQQIVRLELSDASTAIATTHRMVPQDELLRVDVEKPLAKGRHRLTIDFTQNYSRRAAGLYKAVSEGIPYLFTQFEEVDARHAFPCFDEPIFKIPYQVRLSVPKDLVGLANTQVAGESVDGDWKRIDFKPTLPLPSYLTAIAVGPFEFVAAEGTAVPVRIVTPKGKAGLAKLAARETPALLAYQETWFDRPYAFDKLDLIAAPEFAFGAMENPGLIVFRDDILLSDETRDSTVSRRNRQAVIAHELAHLWFGDLVTMAWWDDLWLNESFADWLGDRTVDEVTPQLEVGLQSLRDLGTTMAGDARATAEPIRLPPDARPEQAFQNLDIVYNKGHAVLDMIEGWLGREPFRQGVAKYIAKHAFGNARGPDLWNMLAEVSGKDVPAVMQDFVGQPGLPILSFERRGEAQLRVTQRRLIVGDDTAAAADGLTWRVPILLRYADDAGVRTHAVLLSGAEATIDLPHRGTIAWIYPDADVRGYFRWTLPAANLTDAARHAAERLNVRERIGFLNNLEALLEAGRIDGATYVSLLPPFGSDREPAVLSTLLDRVEHLHGTFVDDGREDDIDRDFAAFVQAAFLPLADRLGWREAPGESEAWRTLRPRILGLLGDEGRHAPTREAARRAARESLADAKSLAPELAGVALRLAAIDGDRAFFDEMVRRTESAPIPQDRDRFLGTLGRFGDPALVEAALAYAASDKVRPTQIYAVVMGVGGQGENGRERVFRWTVEGYDALAKRLPPFALSFLPSVSSGCSLDRLRRGEAFFGSPEHQVPGSARILARVGSQVRACAALRQREGAHVAKALHDLAAGSGPG
jgi:alanyl aminopeptidase